jgi:hypothetical protein
VKKQLERDGFHPVPGESTIRRYFEDVDTNYPPEERDLDQPWRFMPGKVSKDEAGLLLTAKAWFDVAELMGPLTWRIARWLPLVAGASPDLPPDLLCLMAHRYARRERWAKIEGVSLDTSGLDAWLVCTPWRSPEDKRDYEQAVKEGIIRPLDLKGMALDRYPLNKARFERLWARREQMLNEARRETKESKHGRAKKRTTARTR